MNSEKTYDNYVNSGDLKYSSKDFLGAISDYTEVLRLIPSAKLFNKRGNAKMMILKFEDSLSDFDKAIEMDNNFGNAYYLRFIVKIFLNDYVGGRNDIKMAKKLDQENSWSYHSFSIFLIENPDINNSSDLKKDFLFKACPLIH
jgi:tetratricopeptide (TPR) repeat protein